MTRDEYRTVYLASPHWRSLRLQVLARDGYTCTRCGRTPKSLDVHHKTYERLGAERLEDLVTLCRRCHEKKHTGKRPRQKPDPQSKRSKRRKRRAERNALQRPPKGQHARDMAAMKRRWEERDRQRAEEAA